MPWQIPRSSSAVRIGARMTSRLDITHSWDSSRLFRYHLHRSDCMDSFLGWALIIGVTAAFLFSIFWMMRPVFKVARALVSATWRSQAALNPLTPGGRWRLLGIVFFTLGVLILLQGRGYGPLGIQVPNTFVSVMCWMFSGILIATAGGYGFVRAKRFEAERAEVMLQRDPRSPIVYLRSFKADSFVSRSIGRAGFNLTTEEGEIADLLAGIGPLIAIGRPGETLAYQGAARLYVKNSDWQEQVRGLLGAAPLVIVRAGGTPGLQWEIEICVKTVKPERLLFLIPLNRKGYEQFRLRNAEYFPQALPDYHAWRYPVTTVRAVLFFDWDWTPHLRTHTGSARLHLAKVALKAIDHALFVRSSNILNTRSELRKALEDLLNPIIHRGLSSSATTS